LLFGADKKTFARPGRLSGKTETMVEKKPNFLTKLDQLDRRYDEIDTRIADPAVAADATKLIDLSKEQARLRDIVTKYREYKKTLHDLHDTRNLLNDPSLEKDFRCLAQDEARQLDEKKQTLLEQIKEALVMSDENQVSSVIIEIRPGTGGDEAAMFARDLYNMYVKYAENRHWKIEPLEFTPTEIGGLRQAIFSVKGHAVWAELGYEAGTHRVQRVPQTESQGRIHTSAATVAVLPEPGELDIHIDPNDVVEHVSRAGGPGGQSVNKLNSAIKLEHRPTGITVSMRDEKSQHKNRAKAWRILRSRIYEHYESQKRQQRDYQRKTMIGSGDRSQKIRTYNFPQNRLTDHRINLSLYSLDKILAGNMTELISALKDYDKEKRLQNL